MHDVVRVTAVGNEELLKALPQEPVAVMLAAKSQSICWLLLSNK